ncbi:MAG: hypothetical protein ACFB10_15180 [Salibacteraceae bacterium]
MKNHEENQQLLHRIRRWVVFIMVGLALSGLTAFPIQIAFEWLLPMIKEAGPSFPFYKWLLYVAGGVQDTYHHYPFFGYGTDWLAFAHLLLALVYYGAWVDPVRNQWLFRFGFVACAGIVPLAFIAGPLRGIPFAWQLIDCSFGVLCFFPLLRALQLTKRLEKRQPHNFQIATP